MVKVKKDSNVQEVSTEVASLLTSRHGFTIVEELTEDDIRSKLDALGIEYHSQLGFKKLKVLLEKSEA
jgi:hypothetical protein